MSFDRLFRASLYLTLFLATMILSLEASGDSPYAMMYPVAVAATSFLAFLTVDREAQPGIPRELANFLAGIAAVLGLLEWFNNSNIILLAIGHILIYIQIIYYFLKKTVEVDWFLLLIGLVQVVIGADISQNDSVVYLILFWSLSCLWTFSLFFLRREALREGPPPGITVTPAPDRSNPYPGLINLSFVFAMLRIAALTLLLGVAIFYLMPRWAVRGVNRFSPAPSGRHLTGFSTDVQLGRMGEILENDSVVMSVEFSDETNTVIAPDPEILLRGLTFTGYQDKKWTREESDLKDAERLEAAFPSLDPRMRILRQRFKMEEIGSDVLFAVRPFVRVDSSFRNEIVLNTADGTIYRRDQRDDPDKSTSRPANKFDYTVISVPESHERQLLETSYFFRSSRFLQVPRLMADPLSEIAEKVVAGMRPEIRDSPLQLARALERYLRDGDFTYSLKMRTQDDTIDPILDFLKNRKEGHCEYFASALTLLCRSRGVPARLVNGFKGGDWNELGRVLHVREKHAHSWVEVLVTGSNGQLTWETLDPTPSRQRAESVAQVGGGSPRFRYLSDFVRFVWTFYVHGFDSERQERKIYGPIRELAFMALRGFRLMGEMLKDAMSLFYFENVGQIFSVRGFVVSFSAMLLMVGLYRAARWLIRRLFGRHWNANNAESASDPGLVFYQRLVRLLSTIGVERPAAETPREFAKRAAAVLEARPPVAAFSGLPGAVVDVFYAKRFGGFDPEPAFLDQVNHSLDALETNLTAPAA